MIKRTLVLATLLVLVSSGTAVALERKKTGGVTITPALQQLVVEGDQGTREGTFTVQNDSDQTATFDLSTIDMGTLDDTGGLVFSGLSQDYQKKYGLANWMELPQTRLDIPAGKAATIRFTIKNNVLLSPGGHYGAIIVKQANKQTDVDKQVTLSPQAASLLFLLKRGGEVYQLSLQDIKAPHNAWSLPTVVELPFKNEGNVHLVPRGVVSIKNMKGAEIARGIINSESSMVLPERTRTLHVSFDKLAKVTWPGRYTVEVLYRYDGQENFSKYTQVFYAANLRILMVMAMSVLALATVIYVLRRQLRKAVKFVTKALRTTFLRLLRPMRHRGRKVK
ncbi:MAG TPA: hypothetical protein VK694_06355 [Verrucomicrobiae bacterium]|nr:hypothetical protein [Verrucomicrobiae bacterium]